MTFAAVEKRKDFVDGTGSPESRFDPRHAQLNLFTFEKRQIPKKCPKVSDNIRLQAWGAKNLRKLTLNVIVGFLKLVEQGTQEFPIPCNWLAKINYVQLTARLEDTMHFSCCLPFIGGFQVMDHDAGEHAVK